MTSEDRDPETDVEESRSSTFDASLAAEHAASAEQPVGQPAGGTQPIDPQDDVRPPAPQREERKHLPVWQESILLLVIAVLLAVVIKAFFVQAFYIPSVSMEPGLIKNDRILVEKPSYWGSNGPSRGDVIVFADPGDWLPASEKTEPANLLTDVLAKIGLYPTGGHLVKRVIGIGGDEVKCCDAKGRVTVNGQPLSESSYLPSGTAPSTQKFDVKVPQDYLWVMGDNRGDSSDSRAHMGQPGGGFVPVDLVVGKVFALVWPLSRFEFLHRPSTFADIPSSK